MLIKDAFKTATRALTHGKMRSALTMLGIVIGISSVIILMSIGQSAQGLILNQVQGIGSNLIFVIPGGSTSGKFAAPAASQGIVIKSLKQTDVDALDRDPSINAVTAEVRGQAKAVYGDNDITVTYEGVLANFFALRNFKTVSGYPFAQSDVDSFNHVAVIGQTLAETLFGNLNPVGKYIRLGSVSLRVIGLLEKKGTGPGGVDQDNLVVVPMTVAQKQMLGIDYFNIITVQASEEYEISFVKSRVMSILQHSHNIADPNKDDFTVQTQEDVLYPHTLSGSHRLYLAYRRWHRYHEHHACVCDRADKGDRSAQSSRRYRPRYLAAVSHRVRHAHSRWWYHWYRHRCGSCGTGLLCHLYIFLYARLGLRFSTLGSIPRSRCVSICRYQFRYIPRVPSRQEEPDRCLEV